MRSNILFVGLNYDFVKKICIQVADRLDMYFLDVKDLIEYSLIDPKNVEVVCGEKYLQMKQKAIILSVGGYEDTVINFPYSEFLSDETSKSLTTNAVVVYLQQTKDMLDGLNIKRAQPKNLNIEIMAYEEFDTILSQKADIIINISNSNIENIVNKILLKLNKKHN